MPAFATTPMTVQTRRCLLAILLATALAWPAFPVGTTFWRMETYAKFARGTFTGISLSRNGKLSLSPRLEEVFSTGQPLVWAVVEDRAGNLYLGTGHAGKVFKLDAEMNAQEFFDAPEPDVFALAVDSDNNLYVGTSPDGKIYKVAPDGASQEFFNPQANYIWSLVVTPKGTLYVGTGDRGRIYRVSPDGTGSLFFDTRQTHVMSLALAPDQALVAGSEPNGLLYRISPEGKAFVLYDAPLEEIHNVVIEPDGSVLASAMAADAQRRRGGLGGATVSGAQSAAASVTVSVQAGPAPGPEGQKEQEKLQETRRAAARAAQQAASAAALAVPAVGLFAGTRSAIYRVAPDRSVEELWSSKRESVYDILPAADGLLFSTDERGRVYKLNAQKQTTLLVETKQEQTTRLLRRGSDVLAATSNFGKLFRLGTTPDEQGSYESPVEDTGRISRWGKLNWRARVPAGTGVEFFTRSGNASVPDRTWSEWARSSHPVAVGGRDDLFEEQVNSPRARYLQWKAVFHSAKERSPSLEEVSVAYLPQNRAPIIRSVKVAPASLRTPAAQPLSAAPAAASGASADPMVVVVQDTVTASGPSSAPQVSTPTAAPAQRKARQPTITIAWQAEDPDGDRMSFTLYIRGEGETRWKLLKEKLREFRFQPEPESLPDGKYQVRLLASDSLANPPRTARSAERQSAPFLIDNTPPRVQLLKQQRKGSTAQVHFRVTDASGLKRAEYRVDAGPWLPVYSQDGIVDSRLEDFVLQVEKLTPGEHLVVLRAYDFGDNAGMGKAVLK